MAAKIQGDKRQRELVSRADGPGYWRFRLSKSGDSNDKHNRCRRLPASVVRGSSCALLRPGLEIVEIGDRSLRMRGCREDEPFLMSEDREPGYDIARLSRSRFRLRHDAEIGRADTLKGSADTNMKELRFRAANGVWRLAYAFDTERRAILLVAGDKSGGSQTRFYKVLIAKADQRLTQHLDAMTEKKNG